ncbi:hypothetical protein LCGC14_0447980 [marine sediment metagenome]|uniref:Uncharacterized protein n=1 Tax=marine sediment metagenome TaxID=412755 RepID=A0A0F9VST1_9ZZZZ
MIYRGDNYLKCVECSYTFKFGDMAFHSERYGRYRYICQQCSERENMPNIKITAKVDGKIIPLETISTETFEAIKALEKPKEIPVTRVGIFRSLPVKRRLILKITSSIRSCVSDPDKHILAIDTATGDVAAWWEEESDEGRIRGYENVKPL